MFMRLLELAGESGPEAYEHTADAAMAAYLWLLGTRNGDRALLAADAALKCERCWWARKMAEFVMNLPSHGTPEPQRA